MSNPLSSRMSQLQQSLKARREELQKSLTPLAETKRQVVPRPATVRVEPREPTQLEQLAGTVHECDRQLREAIEQFQSPIRAAMAADPGDDALSELIRIREEMQSIRIFADGRHLLDEWKQPVAYRIQQMQLEGFYSDAAPSFRNTDFVSVTRLETNERRFGTGLEVATISFATLARSSSLAHLRLHRYLVEAMPDRSTSDVVVLPSDFCLAAFETAQMKPRTVEGTQILELCRQAQSCLEFLNRS